MLKPTLMFAALALSVQGIVAQNLVLKGRIVGNTTKHRSVSMVNLYTYAANVQESVLREHSTLKGNARFKFNLQVDQGYIVEIISSNGSYKRVIVNTEKLPHQEMASRTCEVNIDIAEGAKWGQDPEDIAWVNYDPTTSCFSLSDNYLQSAKAE